MTDNEIIKVLECCIAPNCGECPIFNNDEIRKIPGRCVFTIEKNALDLINRQQAEIKEWKRVVETWQIQHEKEKAEIERLKKVQVQYVEAWIDEFVERLKNDCLLAVSNTGLLNIVIDELVESMKSDFSRLEDFTDLIKTEAIKEFAERLKEEFIQSVFFEREYQGEKFVKEIDNLVKEMVGEN